MPSAARPPPIRSPETSRTDAASSRICRSVVSSGSKPSCDTKRRARTSRSGSSAKLVCETVRSTTPLEVLRPAERIDERAVLEAARHRVDGEVARRMSSSTDSAGSATISKSCRPGPVLTSLRGGANSIPAGASALHAPVARVEADADEAAGDDELLDAPVRLERPRRPVGVDARHEEVGVLRLEAEQLVADGAADEVRVEPERADVVLDSGLTGASSLPPPADRHWSGERDRLDLDERAGGELRDLDRRARRRRSPTCCA